MPYLKLYRLIFLMLLVTLLSIVACRRQAEQDPLPTTAPTAAITTPVSSTDSPATTPPQTGIDPADIDWSPRLLAIEPAAGTELPLDASITLRFDQPMDQASVEEALQLTPAGGRAVNGRFDWPRADTVIFTPAVRLQQAQQYKLTLADSASGQNGRPLDTPIDLNLQSLGYLEVSQAIPGDGLAQIQTDAAITVVFNRPVTPLVSSGQQAGLPQPLTFDPPVAGSGAWVTTSIYRFTPTQPLNGATTYNASIDPTLESISGGVLEHTYEWSFTTISPQVVTVQPENSRTQVNPTRPISVTFNMPMNTAVTEAASNLLTSDGQTIAVTYTWRDNNRVMALQPQERLPLATTFQLQIGDSASDAGGGATLPGPFISVFTTTPLPAVSSTTPGRNQTTDRWQRGISVEFASPMDPDTLEGQVRIDPQPNRVRYFFNEYDGRYHMSLDFPLERATTYEITIPAGAADPYGNTLGQAYTWQFTTPAAAPLASLNLPGQVSQLSASFPSNVGIMNRNVSQLNITLHELGLPMNLLATPYEVYQYQPAATPLRTWNIDTNNPEGEVVLQNLPLADGQTLPTGVYLLQVSAPEVDRDDRFWQNQQVLLVIAGHNIVVKEMFGEVHAWVTTLADGQPAGGSSLRLFNQRGAQVGTAVTDAGGYARFDHSGQDYLDGVIVVSGQTGQSGFGVTNTNWGSGFRPWQLGIDTRYDDEVPLYTYLYTDRPIYRPGDTVYFKGIVRETQYGRYVIPSTPQQLHLTLSTAFYVETGRFEDEISVTLNGDGTFDGSYTLPDDLLLGNYSLASRGPNMDAYIEFTVADYRAPEFLVQITPHEAELLRGQATAVTLEAELLAGGSAAGLEVRWALYEEQYRPEDVPARYAFGDSGGFFLADDAGFPFGPIRSNNLGRYLGEGQGRTDENGRLTIPIPANTLDDTQAGSRVVNVQATVIDLANYHVSSVGQIVFHAAESYVGIRGDYIGRANSPVTVDLLTVDWNGRAQPNQPVSVTFYRREWTPIRDSDFGLYYTRWEAEDTRVAQVEVTTDDQGQASAQFTPNEGGSYLAVATVTDSAGRSHTSSTAIWVSADDFAAWRVDPRESQMDLTADQDLYQVGDTARILVQLPFAQAVNAWLTIERGTLMEQRVIQLAGGSEVIEIPITAAMAPNVHVTVAAVKGATPGSRTPYADMRVGIVELVVDPERLALNVSLTPQDDQLAPRDTAVYDILVTDHNGNPVQADLSLALVDLAVLTLVDDNATPILDAFYRRQPLRSQLGAGLFISGEGLEPEIPLEGGGLGGGGGDVAMASVLGPTADDEDDARRDFPDTAYWEASLTTGSDGTAVIEIPLPDATTTWRLSSKAVTNDTLVGQNHVDIRATLPLFVRPVTPRFFTVADEIQIGAIVQNNTGTAIEASVSLQASGLSFAPGATAGQSVSVPAHSQRLVRWPVIVNDAPWADLTFRASGGGFSDAAKPSFGIGPNNELPIYRYTGQEIVGTAGSLAEAGRQVEAVLLPDGVDTRQGEVAVEMSPSLAAAMLDALQATNAEDYQRICTHAMVDRLLPNLATRQAIRALSLDEPQLANQLDNLIRTALTQLAGQQLSNGSWGWCGSAMSDPWLTAYTILALTQAETAGYDLGATRLPAAVSYLERQLVNAADLSDSGQANRQAFFVYVLAEAGRPVTDEVDDLVATRRSLLDPYARALLALAYERTGDGDSNRQRSLLTDLNDAALVSAAGTHWQDASRDFRNLSSNVRGTAIVVSALAQIEPNDPLLAPAVRWLMVARPTNRWATSHETAWSLWALTHWLEASGELAADYEYALWVNGRSFTGGHFTQENLTQPEQLNVPLSQLLAAEANFFDFRRGEGDGRFYYSLYLNSHIDVSQIGPAERGFAVQRVYYDADCNPANEACQPLTAITAGERVRVELTVVLPHDRLYVTLEDPLPAGASAIDPNLSISDPSLSSGVERLDAPYRYGYWGWSYFNHIQYRDDRVIFQAQFLPAGTYQYSYYLQTNIPGSFQVRPAVAYESFFPDIFGRSEGFIFTIAAAD
jgi:alpha-2-macroglobulin